MVTPGPGGPNARTGGRLVQLRPGEGRVLLLGAAYFFFLLLSYYLLRPVREAMGVARDVDDLPWLMTATLAGMIAVNPLFAWLVSRTPRRVFVPITYRFFAANLVVFFLLFKFLPGNGGVALGYVFYVWLSIFNLFVVSVFWAVMADKFDLGQAKRLFGILGVGGTLGAIAGAYVTRMLTIDHPTLPLGLGALIDWRPPAVQLAPGWLMLIAVAPLEAAARCGAAVLRTTPAAHHPLDRDTLPPEPGPGVLEGARLVIRSKYLRLISLYMLLFTMTATLLYLEQGRIVAEKFPKGTQRTAAFAGIDLWVNVLTLVTQLLLTSRVIKLLGLRGTLAVMPLISLAGFAALWVWPGYAMITIVQACRRGLHYAIDRPAREALFTMLGPDEKYKSKPIIDTFVYRAGDMAGGWTPKLLARAGLVVGISALALPLCVIWFVTAALIRPERARDGG